MKSVLSETNSIAVLKYNTIKLKQKYLIMTIKMSHSFQILYWLWFVTLPLLFHVAYLKTVRWEGTLLFLLLGHFFLAIYYFYGGI